MAWNGPPREPSGEGYPWIALRRNIGFLSDHLVTHSEMLKTHALLAYLAPEAATSTAAMPWPDRPEGAARAILRHSLRSLRLAIGDYEAEPSFLITTREDFTLTDSTLFEW